MARKYYHVVNIYDEKNNAEAARLGRAARTWSDVAMSAGNRFIGVYGKEYGRSAKDIGDTKDMAFVKDVIATAEDGTGEDSWFVLTNADSCLCSDLISILDALPEQLVWSNRYDVDKPMKNTLNQQQILDRGTHHRGLDLMAGPISVWKSLWVDRYPDMLLGYEAWDAVMIMMLGQEAYVGRPLVYHEIHDLPHWYRNRLTSKGNLYNRSTARAWLAANNLLIKAGSMWPGIRNY